jgi:hypothetical protein
LDPFAFVIVLVAIITAGRLLRSVLPRRELGRDASRRGQEEIEELRGAIDGVTSRLERLEEERDFYRDLLEAPDPPREIKPPASH